MEMKTLRHRGTEKNRKEKQDCWEDAEQCAFGKAGQNGWRAALGIRVNPEQDQKAGDGHYGDKTGKGGKPLCYLRTNNNNRYRNGKF